MSRAARLLLGAVFLVASLDKIRDPALFASAVNHYRILPLGLVPLAALVLPWLEALVGACLVLGIWADAAALLAAGLGTLFAGAVVSAIVRGLDIECGCFYRGMARLSWMHVALDLALIGLAAVVLQAGKTGSRPD